MNLISNIWKQPKTSATGVLIALVTIASVLSRQGITLGKAGSGTVITLAGALATAILGLLAKDPASSSSLLTEPSEPGGAPTADLPRWGGDSIGRPSSNSTTKLGVWALIALLLPATFLSGCSGITVAQEIVNWTPTLQSAVATLNSTASLLEPADAPIFAAATVGFDAASNLLISQAHAYLANPTTPVLQQLQAAVVAFQQNVNASLLQAAKISNPNSQQHVLNGINAVGTVVTAILSLVESVSSKSQVAAMAAQSTIKLASVQTYLNESQAAAIVASHYSEPLELARLQVRQAEATATHSGF
ncbi:MAG: hypothetical protein ABR907_02535 [Terracidiphilus sp.]|jgi:hypothetical protein